MTGEKREHLYKILVIGELKLVVASMGVRQ